MIYFVDKAVSLLLLDAMANKLFVLVCLNSSLKDLLGCLKCEG